VRQGLPIVPVPHLRELPGCESEGRSDGDMNCPVCDKQTRSDRLYCSRACYIEQGRRERAKPCLTCGKDFVPRYSSVKNCQPCQEVAESKCRTTGHEIPVDDIGLILAYPSFYALKRPISEMRKPTKRRCLRCRRMLGLFGTSHICGECSEIKVGAI